MLSYKTALLKNNRFRRDKTVPLLESTSSSKLTVYSTSFKAIQSITGSSSDEGLVKESPKDPILVYITTQRAKLGLETFPTNNPEELECSEEKFRHSLVATSAPIAGVKDLKLFSRRLASLLSEQQHLGDTATIANEFVYAVWRGDCRSCNPYDLCIVPPDKARSQQRYCTISAFTVTEVSLIYSSHDFMLSPRVCSAAGVKQFWCPV